MSLELSNLLFFWNSNADKTATDGKSQTKKVH